MAVRGCFVTGTDTGAGKTIVAAALCAAIRASGERVAAFKPVVTGVDTRGLNPCAGAAAPRLNTSTGPAPPGLNRSRGAAAPGLNPSAGAEAPDGRASSSTAPDEADAAWPHDHELLATVTGARAADVTTRTFEPAVSPHLAAELAGATISLDALVAGAGAAARDADVLVVEGVGGLLVPFSDDHDVRDLAVALGLPLVIAARPGLGTINHSLLTIEAARARGLDVRAVVLTPWPDEPTTMQRSNRDTIASRGDVEVATLRHVHDITDLASAGSTLPWTSWLGGGSI